MKLLPNQTGIFSAKLIFLLLKAVSAQLVWLSVQLPSGLCLCLQELQGQLLTLKMVHSVSTNGPVSAAQPLFGMDPRHGLGKELLAMLKKLETTGWHTHSLRHKTGSKVVEYSQRSQLTECTSIACYLTQIAINF